ncbi:MAG: alpha-ketoacid dehydrogenase subunit beta [Corynebacteriales bacterium]|nr:alpha-ketoacid dehydrogenase subunit beta [Mycobacteriales bacterium]
MSTMTMGKALNSGLRTVLDNDPKTILMGQDIGKLGGVFRITDGLQKDFGSARVVDAPLGEAGIIGTAIGLALRGFRPVCEIQFDGFVFPAFDQITTMLAKMHYRSAGKLRLPITIRIPYGGGIGAVEHHSESPESYFIHTAGLKVVTPSTPADAFAMIQQSVTSDDPIIFLEPKRRYWDKGEIVEDSNDWSALHSARVVREGTDATVAAYGPMVKTSLQAADAAASEGRNVEVIDLRTLAPLDLEPVFTSVRKTGRLIVVHEAPMTLGLGAEISARVTQECFYSLEAPVLRVTGFDTPYPAARVEETYLPDLDRVLDAVDRSFDY